jgi:hypothetical protein
VTLNSVSACRGWVRSVATASSIRLGGVHRTRPEQHVDFAESGLDRRDHLEAPPRRLDVVSGADERAGQQA